jgi:hypothetical protein
MLLYLVIHIPKVENPKFNYKGSKISAFQALFSQLEMYCLQECFRLPVYLA